MKKIVAFFLSILSLCGFAQVNPKLQAKLEQQAKDMEAKVIEWRRHFHENPELSNRETNTGKFIADHLKSLGIEVQARDAVDHPDDQRPAAADDPRQLHLLQPHRQSRSDVASLIPAPSVTSPVSPTSRLDQKINKSDLLFIYLFSIYFQANNTV